MRTCIQSWIHTIYMCTREKEECWKKAVSCYGGPKGLELGGDKGLMNLRKWARITLLYPWVPPSPCSCRTTLHNSRGKSIPLHQKVGLTLIIFITVLVIFWCVRWKSECLNGCITSARPLKGVLSHPFNTHKWRLALCNTPSKCLTECFLALSCNYFGNT